MTAAVIDTLRFADRLKESGIEARHAEGIARAFGEELVDRVVTKRDLDEALVPLRGGILALEARFDGLDPRFVAIDTKFDAMDAKFEALHREVSGKFNLLATMMALGFTLVVGLGLFNALSPRVGATDAESTPTQREGPEGAGPVNALSNSGYIG